MIFEIETRTNQYRGNCLVHCVVSRNNRNDTAVVLAEFTDISLPGYSASGAAADLVEQLTDYYVEPGEG